MHLHTVGLLKCALITSLFIQACVGFQRGTWSFDSTAGSSPLQLGVGPEETPPDAHIRLFLFTSWNFDPCLWMPQQVAWTRSDLWEHLQPCPELNASFAFLMLCIQKDWRSRSTNIDFLLFIASFFTDLDFFPNCRYLLMMSWIVDDNLALEVFLLFSKEAFYWRDCSTISAALCHRLPILCSCSILPL